MGKTKYSGEFKAKVILEVLKEALKKHGKPEIFNTDQGSQFTSKKFIDILKNNEIKILIDSVDRWVDNVIIERF